MPGNAAVPSWEGARNLGDLGGLPLRTGGCTKSGRVYRSAAHEWLTSKGWDDVRAAGVATVIDLRNEMERGRSDGHPVLGPDDLAGITVVHAPTEDPNDEQFLKECGPWLDHPRSWPANLRLYPDKIARVLMAIADADTPLLVHCAGGRDRTGMIGSVLLVLAGATPGSVVANYEAGFRGAARHRGHGWAYDADADDWVTATDRPWTEDELEAALDDRRGVILEWVEAFDPASYLLDAGVSEERIARLEQLLVG